MASGEHTPRAAHGVVDDDTDLLFVVGAAGGDGQVAEPAAQPRRGRRILLVLTLALALLLALAAGTIFFVTESLGNNVERVPNVFGNLDATARPPANDALTFLLVGTDSRSAAPTTGTDAAPDVDPGSQRSDVLMIARINPSRTGASVVSIPRDSWVDIPDHGFDKINAAYAFGGPALLVQTIEQLTDVRVDHFAVIDFAGFQSMVDAVGGIEVQVAAATSNDGVQFREGVNSLNGEQALAYVRQRYDLPRGDIDRAQRQQNALRALLDKAVSSQLLVDPVQLYRLLDAISRSVGVDDTLSNGRFREFGLALRGLRPSGVEFLGAPVQELGREGDRSVVYLDEVRSAELWEALRTDTVSAYVARNPGDSLGETPP